MWIKLILLILVSCVIILYGMNLYKRGLTSSAPYDFKEDFKHTFFTPHLKYSSHLKDDKPRKIAPVVLILGGVGILAVGILKILRVG